MSLKLNEDTNLILNVNKLFTILTLCFISSVATYAQYRELEPLLTRLDSVLANSEQYIQEKEEKIQELRKKQPQVVKAEERLWFNKMIYDEYCVYNADSAMVYVNKNIEIAHTLGRTDKEQEWMLNKIFLLTAQGLLNEAEKELLNVNVDQLNAEAMYQYYDTQIYLYSHSAQFIGARMGLTASYARQEAKLKDEAKKHIHHDHPLYYSFLASLYRDSPHSTETDSIKVKLKAIVDKSQLATRIDAINAYMLATLFQRENNEYGYIKYLIYSAIADIKTCNRDIASLEELSNLLYQLNDIDRGYAYINYCLKAALLYPNRIRVINISAVMDKIQQAYSQQRKVQEQKLKTSLATATVLSVVLFIALCFIYYQFQKLSRSRMKLNENNKLLNSHILELSKTQQMLAEVNNELSMTNKKLTESNNQLLESNYVKEEYIGYVFSICSNYISKLEEYRKNINRKLKAGQINEICTFTSNSTLVQAELKDFYHSFDAIFLHVYPDFVEDFNSLLRPEERITLKEGELLNTELRIYALVRLGINDSVKIAEFLHYSPQTVYNNRLKARNKAIVPKDEFAERVRSLGKIQK